MHILFEAIRVYCIRGQLIIYESWLHACHGDRTLAGGTNDIISHSLTAATISCRQLPDDLYKDAFLN
jgi:hypothetical protein